MFILNWLISKTIRQATDTNRQVKMLLNEQRDLLRPEAIANLEKGIADMREVIRANPGRAAVEAEIHKLEKTANANLKPYEMAAVRENVREIMVAVTTILAFTTFFLQLTKIPTGSMQPTLFGITHDNLRETNPDFKVPGFLGRMRDYWWSGIKYVDIVAPVDGEVEAVQETPTTILPFIKKQAFRFAGKTYTIWLPPDDLFTPMHNEGNRIYGRADLRPGMKFKKGESIIKVRVVAGDHLLVDRFTYNFRKPKRGEIIVFKTRGIQGLDQDQLYIKRLVALGGETVQIGDDNHLIIDGKRLDASVPHFESVYTPDDQTKRWPYRGHMNNKTMGGNAPEFRDADTKYKVGPDRFLPMGDNTMNSQDGRYFGDVDRRNILGKCFFVYWPITDRFGWGVR